MKLYAPSTIKEIEERYGFRFTKSLGQNFLVSKHIIDCIMEDSFISQEDLVIEIGPGIGVLTEEAARRAKRVIAIEIDKALIPILEDTLKEYDNVTILNQDVLKTDLEELIQNCHAREKGGKVRIIGNLPYYITTSFCIMTVMLSAETPSSSIFMIMGVVI